MTRLKPKAFTLIEVLASVAILAGIIVTLILWSANGLAANMEMEQRLKSSLLAESEMEDIKASLADNFMQSWGGLNKDLGENFLAATSVLIVPGNPGLKKVEVSVGYDKDGNGILTPNEESMVTLTTQVAERNN